MPTKQTNPKVAEACIKVVEDAFRRMAPAITFSQAAESIDQNIIEYESRMRVFGMEIFNATCRADSPRRSVRRRKCNEGESRHGAKKNSKGIYTKHG